jgi:hypothetical protein
MGGLGVTKEQIAAFSSLPRSPDNFRMTDPSELTGGARPPGMVLVHNHVRRIARSSTRGFRAWLQPPAANLVECDCGWRPELGAHYRVAGGFLAAER